jgi:iron(III) transport system substrate-binding protein
MRRSAMGLMAAVGVLACAAFGCSREPAGDGPPSGVPASGSGAGRVVVYTSADDPFARLVADAFEARTGIQVLLTGDSEATKTVGLSRRLLEEASSPRADVWWSSEPFYSVRLAEAGVLEPLGVPSSAVDFGGSWPAWACAGSGAWHGFGLRARVIAYDERKVTAGEAPRRLRDLAEPRWRGRVGMARPQFGTTVGHLAALVHLWGAEPTRTWLESLEANGLRVYDSNSAVVRAIAEGEIEVGLTDTDDVWVGRSRGWRVGHVYESDESPLPAAAGSVAPLEGFGALVIPNSAALVRGGPNPVEARRFVEFLLSADGEALLMGSESRNVPLRADLAARLAAEHPETAIVPAAEVDLEAVAGSIEAARRMAEDVLGF